MKFDQQLFELFQLMSPRKCKFFSECKKSAVYRIPYSGLNLCKEHFLQNVQKRIKKWIEKRHMFHPFRNEKVLIAASGGKDSQVLLHALKQIYPEGLDVHALYIDLGIGKDQYSPDSLTKAQNLCQKLNIPFHVINIEDEYGLTIDMVYRLYHTYENHDWINESNSFRGMCSYCGAFKRYNINKYAYDNDFTSVATGHNLTDESTSLINNFFNVNLHFLANTGSVNDSHIEELVPRVKPLFYISEEEIMMYAYYANLPHNPTECPYSRLSPNTKLKIVMNKIERQRPGNMIATMRRFTKEIKPVIEHHLKEKYNDQNKHHLCLRCRRPTFAKICAFCRILDSLNGRLDRVNQQLGVNLRLESEF